MKPTTSPYIIVKNSKVHGKGVFARKNIPEGTKVIEYVGEKLTKAQSDKRSDEQLEKAKHGDGAVYIFELNKRYDIDGNVPWNTARLINHSCDPNCETDIVKGHIWIIALRDIKKSEELSYDYNFDIDDYEEHPCRCGSKNCVGYIVGEDHWPKLKRRLAKKKAKKTKTKKAKKKKTKTKR